MATIGRRTVLTGLMLTTALCAGCNVMALPFFLIPGLEPTHEPKCKLASSDKNKEVKVVILASTGLENRSELVRADRELSALLIKKLQEYYKKNKEKVALVPASRVEKYKDEHPNWKSLAPEDIGKHFRADYVIDMEIQSLTLYEPGSSRTIFQGRSAIELHVIDVHHPSEGPIYDEQYRCEYPRARGPIFSMDSDPAQFREMFLNVIARELSWRFTSHPVDDDIQCD